jgi:hypothetical protein
MQLQANREKAAGIRALLQDEEERFANSVAPLFPENDASGRLRKLIVHVFEAQKRPLDLDEIKGEIAKTDYDFGEKKPGRAIHFALLGMGQTGDVERQDDKRWIMKDKGEAIKSASPLTQ